MGAARGRGAGPPPAPRKQKCGPRYALTISMGYFVGLLGVFTPEGTYCAFGDTYTLFLFR